MHVLRIEHGVPDFQRWKSVFDSDPIDRKGGGVRSYRVLHSDDGTAVAIDLDFDTAAQAEEFRQRLEALWAGPAAEIARDPRARIWELADSADL